MTNWRTLIGIPNGRVFSPNAKGFSLNSVHGSRMRIFCGFYAKGARVCAYSARIKVPECVQKSKGSHAQIEGNHHKTNVEDKILLLIAEIPTSLVQTNQKACSAQTEDE
jgi:hypothetical protein